MTSTTITETKKMTKISTNDYTTQQKQINKTTIGEHNRTLPTWTKPQLKILHPQKTNAKTLPNAFEYTSTTSPYASFGPGS